MTLEIVTTNCQLISHSFYKSFSPVVVKLLPLTAEDLRMRLGTSLTRFLIKRKFPSKVDGSNNVEGTCSIGEVVKCLTSPFRCTDMNITSETRSHCGSAMVAKLHLSPLGGRACAP